MRPGQPEIQPATRQPSVVPSASRCLDQLAKHPVLCMSSTLHVIWGDLQYHLSQDPDGALLAAEKEDLGAEAASSRTPGKPNDAEAAAQAGASFKLLASNLLCTVGLHDRA